MNKERRRMLALVRQERLLRDQAAIRALREHYTGYSASDGFSLDLRKIAEMPYHRRRALRKKFTKTQQLLATPHVVVKPRTTADAKVLRRETRQRARGLKHYIVHVPDPKRSTAKVVEGQLEIRTKLPGKAAVEERMFHLPRRPKSPDDLLEMLDELLDDMPDSGHFQMQTDTYGDTGEIASKGALRRQLQSYLAAYDKAKYGRHRFMNRVIGWRWVRSKLAGRIIRQDRAEERERLRMLHREQREEYRRQAQLDLKPTVCKHGIVLGRRCKRCPRGIAKR
jgi:hypothetical protein